MKTILVIGLLVLASCAGTPEVRGTNALAIACSSYAVTLKSLAKYQKAGKLPADVTSKVDAANKLIDPVCLPGSIADPALAIGIVNSGIGLLNQVKSSI